MESYSVCLFDTNNPVRYIGVFSTCIFDFVLWFYFDYKIRQNYKLEYKSKNLSSGHLFWRLFCLYQVILCARSDDVTACFFAYKWWELYNIAAQISYGELFRLSIWHKQSCDLRYIGGFTTCIFDLHIMILFLL